MKKVLILLTILFMLGLAVEADANLAGWIEMEGSGNGFYEDKFNGNDANLSPTHVTTAVDTQRGNVASFDTDGYINYPDVNEDDYDPAGHHYTVAAWIKTTGTGAFMEIYTKGGGSSSPPTAYTFKINDSGIPFCMVKTTDHWAISSGGAAVTDGVWHHMVVTYDGNDLITYIDANQVASSSPSGTSPNDVLVTDELLWLGNPPDGGGTTPGYRGYLDDVRYYNHTLSAGDVSALYTATFYPPTATNPSPADGVTGIDVNDDISWIAGSFAASHDVYFGTDSTPDATEFIGNQAGVTYDPGTLTASTTYYWSIDEVNGVDAWAATAVWSFTTCTGTASSDYYVDGTNGNDSNDGSSVEEAFATLDKARDVVRAACDLPSGGVNINIKGGKYFRTSTLALDAQDSGTAAKPIIWQAVAGEDVRIIGGVELDYTNFSLVMDANILNRMEAAADGNVYECNLTDLGITDLGQLRPRGTTGDYLQNWVWTPDTAAFFGQIRSHMELSFNENIMTLARWPNDDSDYTTDDFDRTANSVDVDELLFIYDGSRPERWSSATNPWAHGYWRHAWQDWHEAIIDINSDSNTITLAPKVAGAPMIVNWPADKWRTLKHKAWYALNLLEEIDTAGEFYVEYDANNHYNGMLYIWPPTNDINSADEIIVSTLGDNEECLVTTNNTSYVTFSGITFEMNRHNVFEISGGDSVLIDDCVIRNTGTNAVFILSGVNHGVQNCEIYDTGGMGVRILGGDRDALTSANNFATNNHIYDFARLDRGNHPAVAIEGCGNQATYNWIHSTPQEAIYFSGNNHDIKYNKIHNVCQEAGDAGAIYSWMDWSFRGNEISYNYIYDFDFSTLRADPNYGNSIRAIYLDGYFSSADIFGNIISGIAGHAMFHQGGQDNNFQNNIVVKSEVNFFMTGGPAETEGKACDLLDSLKAFDYKKEPWSEAYPIAALVPNDCNSAAFTSNYEESIYSEFTSNLSWDNDTWISFYGPNVWPNMDMNDNYENVDPRFYDEASGVLAVHDDSPAYEINNFTRVPWELMGNLDLDLATRPVPPDSATGVVMDPNLYWAPAFDANSHTVYFSTNSSDVSTRAAGANKGEFSDSNYAPGGLSDGTTYYWAIDGNDVDGNPLASGDLWSFTTRSVKALTPIPSNGEVLVNKTKAATLRWQRGGGADDRDVYFGVDSSPDAGELVSDDTTAMSYDATSLTENTVYYWRIDSNDGGTVTTGDVWSFTTSYGLIGQWQFENNYNDASTYGNDGTAYGDATIVNDASRGYVLSTDGTGDWVEIPNESAFDVSQEVTLMAWVSTTDDGTFMSVANKGQYGWRFTKAASNKGFAAITVNGYDNPQIGGSTSINGGTWYHVAISYDQVSRRLYVNGEQNGYHDDVGTLYTNNYTLLIGDNTSTANQCWNGYIDDVRVYNYALSTAEIDAIYDATQSTSGATNVSPTDSAMRIDVNDDLSWSYGEGIPPNDFDVYFGTTSPGDFKGNQAGTTYEPGTMTAGTTYYWRIDANSAAGIITGDIWSFKTTTGLIGWWKFNGDYTDSSGMGNDGDPCGAVSIVSDANRGDVLFINASDESVTIPNESDYDITGDFTLAAWVKITSGGFFRSVVCKGDSDGYRVNIDGGNKIWGKIQTIDGYSMVGGPPDVNDGDWHHLVMTWDGSYTRTYTDKVNVASDAISGVLTTNDHPIQIGNNDISQWFEQPLYGYIDDVRVYDVALSQDDINDVYDSGQAPDKATSPAPANAATDIKTVGEQLSWSAGIRTNTHDVYLGTVNPPVTEVSDEQAGTTYSLSQLEASTVYYWRIDEVGDGGTTAGDVWSFTTCNGLIGHWEFDGDYTDSSVLGNDGDPCGTISIVSDAGRDNVVLIDATSEAVTIPNETDYDFTGNYTVASWVKATSDGIFRTVVCKGDTEAYRLNIDNIDHAWARVKTSTGYTTVGTAPDVSNNEWHHLVTTYDGSYLRLYVDKSPIASSAITGSVTGNDYPIQIGSNFLRKGVPQQQPLYGWVDDVRVYSYALSGTDINSVFDATVWAEPAHTPTPSDAATDVTTTTDLSWSAGSNTDDYNVYFGTTSPGASQDNQSGTTFDTGTMSSGTTYYWRIDPNNTNGNTTTGTVWSFTTEAAPDTDAPTPNAATFSSPPAADSPSAISMTATTGSDATGPVEYYFDETSGEPNGTDSGWQTSPNYTDSDLVPSTQYTYTVQMRDSVSPTPNVGTASSPANATTDSAVLFSDGFDVSEWNSVWVEDAQNDFFRTTSVKHDGAASAGVDGGATDATLTTVSNIDVSSSNTVTVACWWWIDSTLDSGEYLKCEYKLDSGSWTELDSLDGDVDAEDTWVNMSQDVDTTGITNMLLRFKANISNANEDAYADTVTVTHKN